MCRLGTFIAEDAMELKLNEKGFDQSRIADFTLSFILLETIFVFFISKYLTSTNILNFFLNG